MILLLQIQLGLIPRANYSANRIRIPYNEGSQFGLVYSLLKNYCSAYSKIKLKEKLNNIKNLVSNFGKSFQYEINHSDEVVFDQFSRLASPEMVAMEHTVSKSKTEVKPYKKKSSFSYNYLPVVPYVAPRTKKSKIINFTKKLDQEILQLVNVFKSLNLETPTGSRILPTGI